MIDYHIHSTHSGDGHASIEEMCRRAIERGLSEIAFTDHFDNNPADDCYGLWDAADFCRDVDECRKQLGDRVRILKGVELGEPHLYPMQIERAIDGLKFDLVVGAVHWVGDTVISVDCLTHVGGDSSRRLDRTSPTGVASYMTALYHDYFDEVLRAVECASFDVLAHLDLVKRFGVKYLGPFGIEPYREQIEAILRTMIERGIALEVNTSGCRQPCGEPFPALETLRLYREFGGELITIGSDAHLPEHLGFGLEQGMDLIREAGFEAITLYRDRKPSQTPIV